MPTAQELLLACDRLGGRARQALVARVLEVQSRESFAGGLGISAEAGDVMLFRALAELEAALGGRDVPPPAEAVKDAEERAAAAALAQALDGGASWAGGGGSPVERRLALCQALRAAPEVKAALVQPPPPPPTLPERARRLAWLALVITAAILWSWYRSG